MAAEVCLLLMQSLTGDCDWPVMMPTTHRPVATADSPTDRTGDRATILSEAIAPAAVQAAPKMGDLCSGDQAHRLAVCVVPAKARENWQAPTPTPPNTLSTPPPPSVASGTATAANIPATLPAPVELPTVSRSVPLPTVRAPQFSGPTAVAANAPVAVSTPRYGGRPSNGAELYRQRQLALWSGRSYTRIAPDAYADRWRNASRQPTYQDWKNLLAQEAHALASGQGQNRLEVIVGDSFGLWLPPELLPRDRLWLNQSISGDTTAGILQRVGTFANTRATTIHLMAGANDLKNGVPEAQIVSNLQRTVTILQRQHPQARIIVYPVLPTRRAEIANDRVRSLNTRLAQMTQQRGVEYRNIHHWFQDDWGHLHPDLTTDGLHLNPQGYALWQQAILARSR